jgi:hypothetical protein
MPPYVDTLNNMEPYTSQGMTCHQAGLKRCGRRSAESQAEPCSHDACQAPVAPAVVRLQVEGRLHPCSFTASQLAMLPAGYHKTTNTHAPFGD